MTAGMLLAECCSSSLRKGALGPRLDRDSLSAGQEDMAVREKTKICHFVLSQRSIQAFRFRADKKRQGLSILRSFRQPALKI